MNTALLVAMMLAASDKTAAPKKNDKATTTQVRCQGVNECKGKGACGGPDSSCAGTNACKGKGWILLTEKECKEKKGTVLQ